MKKLIAIAALTALAGSAYAQLASLPPLATNSVGSGGDGLTIVSTGGVNSAAWTTAFGGLYFASDDNLHAPAVQPPAWNQPAPSQIGSILADINANGGAVRAIFLGESAGWHNDFGYSYSGDPAGAGSYTAFHGVQALPPTSNPKSGDYFDLNFGVGELGKFDFWLNAVGGMPWEVPTPPSQFGGVYTVFDPANSVPFVAGGNVRWLQSYLMVDTYVPTFGVVPVSTFVVGLEDWRRDRGSDGDYNDIMIAFQFYKSDGTPFSPVPEPSTYGILGALALLGVVGYRRFKRSK
jgi:hypothetical protein